MRPESSYIVKSSGYALFIRRVYLLGYFIYVLFIASVSDGSAAVGDEAGKT